MKKRNLLFRISIVIFSVFTILYIIYSFSINAKIGKTTQYHNNFKNPQWKSQQRIERVIEITRTMYDNFEQIFDLGGSPRTGADFQSGLNIRVKKN